MSNEKLFNWLFETNAVRVCPEDKPFWYTSGTIGPYYINTHFLYGSEEKANELLKTIDSIKNEKLECPEKLIKLLGDNYSADPIYRGLIDYMLAFIKSNIDITQVDYISGGERRDWFFSLMIAELLGKPHITIYKNMDTVISYMGETKKVDNINNGKVLHIADLITEASSYKRAWIPAIKNIGGNILWSLVVVDRKQGGGELLESFDIASYAMVSIDPDFFEKIFAMDLINKAQLNMLLEYSKNPKRAMEEFMDSHPEFLEESLAADEKTAERARLYIENKNK